MVKYLFFTWKNVPGPGVSAFAPTNIPPDRELMRTLTHANELPFDFTLVKLTPHRNGLDVSPDLSGICEIWPDYMPNSQAWPLCSAKLREVIDRHLIHDEDLQWISTKISGGGETKEYYVARFDTMHDVLDKNQTTYAAETNQIIRPWFSLEKINRLSIFPKPSEPDYWRITSSLYVSEALMRDILKSGVTGVAFEEVRVS